MEPATLARRYYETIDAGDYEALAGLLAPGFTHHRPDRTIEGREAFVAFMREERPETDTSHDIEAVYTRDGGAAVEGRLLRADGSEWFGFVDAFSVTDGTLTACRTYTT
ncbi:MAG: nuclear transport factor 2 family protein [Halobacteriaceae archaeon]